MEICYWEECSDLDNVYDTDCGEVLVSLDKAPKDNRYRFCPYCGKQLIQLITNKELNNENN